MHETLVVKNPRPALLYGVEPIKQFFVSTSSRLAIARRVSLLTWRSGLASAAQDVSESGHGMAVRGNKFDR